MIDIICQNCDGGFSVPNSRRHTARYCSSQCYYESKAVTPEQRKENRNNRRRELEAERRDAGLCPKCGRETDDEFLHCFSCRSKYKIQPSRSNEKTKRYQRKARQDCLDHYGRECACPGCDVDVEMFLEFDHIGNDGAEHRQDQKISSLPVWLRRNRFPEGFQVLCRNCNWGKHINGGVCPHIERINSEL